MSEHTHDEPHTHAHTHEDGTTHEHAHDEHAHEHVEHAHEHTHDDGTTHAHDHVHEPAWRPTIRTATSTSTPDGTTHSHDHSDHDHDHGKRPGIPRAALRREVKARPPRGAASGVSRIGSP